jgi:hypothetical protein
MPEDRGEPGERRNSVRDGVLGYHRNASEVLWWKAGRSSKKRRRRTWRWVRLLPRKNCAFCGQQRKSSNEHVFPRWLGPYLGAPAGTPVRVTITRMHEREVTTRGARELDIQANAVCKDCNENWMNDLEAAARPHLIPMIQAQATIFNTEAQFTVTAWTVKMAMVAEFMKRRTREPHFKALERESFRDTLIPPRNVQVWIARYQGEFACHCSAHDLMTLGRDGTLAPAYCATFAAGHFAFQVFAYRAVSQPQYFSVNQAPGGMRWEDALILPLHPPVRGVALLWPPRHTLMDESFDRLARRFAVLGDFPS